jgi:hypothetical protein
VELSISNDSDRREKLMGSMLEKCERKKILSCFYNIPL